MALMIDSNQNNIIDTLYNDLELLQREHKNLLKQEYIVLDVQKLKTKIDECRNNSQPAFTFLQENGQKILDDIKCRLNAAVCEEIRMVEESPSIAETSTGSTINSTHQAVALARNASEKLEPALKEIENS